MRKLTERYCFHRIFSSRDIEGKKKVIGSKGWQENACKIDIPFKRIFLLRGYRKSFEQTIYRRHI